MRSMSTVFAVTTDAIATRRPKPVTPEAKYRRSASLRTTPMPPPEMIGVSVAVLWRPLIFYAVSVAYIYAVNTAFII
jgi:hypothetical protein